MSTYNPEYIDQLMNFSSGDIITADEYNTILNKLISQGDHNSEWLDYLDKIGIPAAIASISGEDIAEYISTQVSEQIEYLTEAAASRTTGFTDEKTVVIINTTPENTTQAHTYPSALAATTELYTGNALNISATCACVYNGYSGTDYATMTKAARDSDASSLRNALITNRGSYDYIPTIYQGHAGIVNPDILKNNVAVYLYDSDSSADLTYISNLNSIKDNGYQFPVIPLATAEEFTTVVGVHDINDILIVAIDYSAIDVDAFAEIVTSTGCKVISMAAWLKKWMNNLYNGNRVYSTYLTQGSKSSYSNVYDGVLRLGLTYSDGDIVINVDDIMLSSESDIVVTQVGNGLQFSKGGTVILTYSPEAIQVNDKLVGTQSTTSTMYPVVAATSSTSGATGVSRTNNTIRFGNKFIEIDGHKVPYVVSYDSASKSIVIGGF